MGVKMGWIQIKMGHPLARNGAALAPFRAHPSYSLIYYYNPACVCVVRHTEHVPLKHCHESH